MQESAQLIRDACDGKRPTRTPVFDLLCNDAVIEHFASGDLNGVDPQTVAMEAAGKALDGTRCIGIPHEEGKTWTDENGFEYAAQRWTIWMAKRPCSEMAEWADWIERYIERVEAQPEVTDQESGETAREQSEYNARLNGTMNIHCTPGTSLNAANVYLGLEMLSYLWADRPELLKRWFRAMYRESIRHIERAAHAETSPLAMIYSDVAYRGAPMYSPAMFREAGFFDEVAGFCEACHQRGVKVIFHSDGDFTSLLDDLVAAGIDGVNPIEKAAGMDVFEIRRRFPELILVGGVDVTHLLPRGTPEQVRAETRRIIRETGSEGRLLIGSSTELGNDVPLENFLAMREAAFEGF